jgi:hypothetical protein
VLERSNRFVEAAQRYQNALIRGSKPATEALNRCKTRLLSSEVAALRGEYPLIFIEQTNKQKKMVATFLTPSLLEFRLYGEEAAGLFKDLEEYGSLRLSYIIKVLFALLVCDDGKK